MKPGVLTESILSGKKKKEKHKEKKKNLYLFSSQKEMVLKYYWANAKVSG